ncbi:SRPBCC family protein [Erythrobacteraceae bacterium E2-1 Yellow Sea]|nr:SRPBCC family protein [Erythrobacteraceae bacterium E2-1 Yellow Sea]
MRLKLWIALAALPLAVMGQPAAAEIVKQDDNGFVTRDAVEVTADTKAAWLALISPAKWWSKAHTWSADSANLTLRPQAGGCFCEKIPEVPDAKQVTLEGSVEHMRVLQAYPERALRMRGSLGPLQGEAVTGVLTIALAQTDQGTRIVWEYVVGGYMRYETPVIAQAVDGVMSQQLGGLADFLGRVKQQEAPTSAPADEAADADQEPENVLDAIDAMARD